VPYVLEFSVIILEKEASKERQLKKYVNVPYILDFSVIIL
jgi:hypothetical protein